MKKKYCLDNNNHLFFFSLCVFVGIPILFVITWMALKAELEVDFL